MEKLFLILIAVSLLTSAIAAQTSKPVDTITTKNGPLLIHFFGHASLLFEFQKKNIYVDPVSSYVDAEHSPKADIILCTHEHFDHYDPKTISSLSNPATIFIHNPAITDKSGKEIVLANGQSKTVEGITIEAVPAYNTTKDHLQFHPKGRDNGYILTFGNIRIYIAGDTEDIPEMKNLQDIDIAFLPMNQPYTMTPEQVINAVKMFGPKILYPYHFGNTDTGQLQKLFKTVKGIELRIRPMS